MKRKEQNNDHAHKTTHRHISNHQEESINQWETAHRREINKVKKREPPPYIQSRTGEAKETNHNIIGNGFAKKARLVSSPAPYDRRGP
jgi:hypothetical protein